MNLGQKVGASVLFISLVAVMGQAQTTIPVNPGDTGTLRLPFQNQTGSLDSFANVTVSITTPTQVQIQSGGSLGPVTIEPGQAYTFLVPYLIASNAAALQPMRPRSFCSSIPS